jgi:hypothetical protein
MVEDKEGGWSRIMGERQEANNEDAVLGVFRKCLGHPSTALAMRPCQFTRFRVHSGARLPSQ